MGSEVFLLPTEKVIRTNHPPHTNTVLLRSECDFDIYLRELDKTISQVDEDKRPVYKQVFLIAFRV